MAPYSCPHGEKHRMDGLGSHWSIEENIEQKLLELDVGNDFGERFNSKAQAIKMKNKQVGLH